MPPSLLEAAVRLFPKATQVRDSPISLPPPHRAQGKDEAQGLENALEDAHLLSSHKAGNPMAIEAAPQAPGGASRMRGIIPHVW